MSTGAAIAGKYHLLRPLGKGSMGEVWAAKHVGLGREVALKLIYEGSPELAARLKREAQACGRLEHPNIVRVYDYGETDTGDPFLVMELLTGETLADRLEEQQRLPVAEALAIVIDVARALGAAHDAGVVHRDLKPANVFLCKNQHGESVKVLDFGVSKILAVDDMGVTTTGALVGSPAYMSPEQARALREIDPRADLWSVGVLLFEMLTGTRPFPSPTVVGVVADILAGPIPMLASALPGVDPRLDLAVRRCMTRPLDQRMPSAAALIDALTPVLASLRAPPPPPPSPAASRPAVQYDDVPLNPNDPDEASTIALPQKREAIVDEPSDSEKETNVLGGAAGAAMRAVARAALANRAPSPARPAPQVQVMNPPPAPAQDSEEAPTDVKTNQENTIPTRIIANPFATRAPTPPSSQPGQLTQPVQPSQPGQLMLPRNMTIPMGSPWNTGRDGGRPPMPPGPAGPVVPHPPQPPMPPGPAGSDGGRPPGPAGPALPQPPAPLGPPAAIRTWPTQPPDVTSATRLVLPAGWASAPSDARRILWITAIAGLVVGLVVFVGLSLLR